MPLPADRKRLTAAVALFALNAWLCAPLFHTEYLGHLQSNEGSFVTFSKFLLQYWPHVRWFPWFDCGIPYEATYLPLAPVLTAIGAAVTGVSPGLVFHFLAAMAYSLAPVTLFLFAESCRTASPRRSRRRCSGPWFLPPSFYRRNGRTSVQSSDYDACRPWCITARCRTISPSV